MMIRLLQLFWSGCWHKWETMQESRLENADGNTGIRVYLRCAHCGAWKKQDLI